MSNATVAITAVDVTLQVATSRVPTAGTVSGVLVSFEVEGGWTREAEVCVTTAPAEVISYSSPLAAWPTRLRLRQGPGPRDAWGIYEVRLRSGADGEYVLAERACADCAPAEADGTEWLWQRGPSEDFRLPLQGSPAWVLGSWGPCCCPADWQASASSEEQRRRSPVSSTAGRCVPDTRSRSVACSAGPRAIDVEACMAVEPRPIQVEDCPVAESCRGRTTSFDLCSMLDVSDGCRNEFFVALLALLGMVLCMCLVCHGFRRWRAVEKSCGKAQSTPIVVDNMRCGGRTKRKEAQSGEQSWMVVTPSSM